MGCACLSEMSHGLGVEAVAIERHPQERPGLHAPGRGANEVLLIFCRNVDPVKPACVWVRRPGFLASGHALGSAQSFKVSLSLFMRYNSAGAVCCHSPPLVGA